MPNRFEKPGVGFLDLAVSQLKKAKNFLDDVERIVDWAPIEKLLQTAFLFGVLQAFPLITIRPTPPPSAASAIT